MPIIISRKAISNQIYFISFRHSQHITSQKHRKSMLTTNMECNVEQTNANKFTMPVNYAFEWITIIGVSGWRGEEKLFDLINHLAVINALMFLMCLLV